MKLKEFLDKNRESSKSIIVIGDVGIDLYHKVEVTRISPEAPFPIMRSYDETPLARPAMGANVVNMFKYFNVTSKLIGFSSSDTIDVFKEYKLPFTHYEYGEIPLKKRFMCNGQQIARWDVESVNYGMGTQELKESLHRIIKDTEGNKTPDAVIFSDYNKGFFNHHTEKWLSRFKNTITVVDPKCHPITKWKGCSVFKPNCQEAKILSGKDNWKKQCEFFLKKIRCQNVVITRGDNGVVGFGEQGFFEINPVQNIKVANVCGAGDCFVAFLTMALTHGFNIEESANIAFSAGEQFVQKEANKPLLPCDLSDKFINPKDLINRNFKLVFTNGCFDFGLTVGHIECLKFAKQQGQKLVVALNSDTSIKRLKGNNRPVLPLKERMQIIASLPYVDFVTSFDEDTPLELIKTINPQTIIKGGDYEKEKVVGYGLAEEVIIYPLVNCLSTTDKIKLTNQLSS